MSYRHAISAVLLPVTLLHLSGCVTSKWVTHDDIHPNRDTVEKIVMVDGDSLTFNWRKGWGKAGEQAVIGYVDQRPVRIELADVSAARVKRTDAIGTVAMVLAATAAIATGILLLTWDSGWGSGP